MSARAVLQRHGLAVAASPAQPVADAPAQVPEVLARRHAASSEPAELAAVRRRLAAIAEAEGVPARLVRALGPPDLEGCVGLREAELRAYLAALARAALMDAGYVPPGWNRAGVCQRCGPVYLPGDHAPEVAACPWCRVTRAGGDFIRPPVRCGECVHFRASPFNPEAGAGACALGKVRRFAPMPYPHAKRQCRFWLRQTAAEARGASGGGDDGREVGSAAGGLWGPSLDGRLRVVRAS